MLDREDVESAQEFAKIHNLTEDQYYVIEDVMRLRKPILALVRDTVQGDWIKHKIISYIMGKPYPIHTSGGDQYRYSCPLEESAEESWEVKSIKEKVDTAVEDSTPVRAASLASKAVTESTTNEVLKEIEERYTAYRLERTDRGGSKDYVCNIPIPSARYTEEIYAEVVSLLRKTLGQQGCTYIRISEEDKDNILCVVLYNALATPMEYEDTQQ